jgi:hypothetical protein
MGVAKRPDGSRTNLRQSKRCVPNLLSEVEITTMTKQNCPKSLHIRRCFITGMTLEQRCGNCEWSVTSSILKYIDADKSEYELSINGDVIVSEKLIIVVTRLFDLSKTRLYQIRKEHLFIKAKFRAYPLKVAIDILDEIQLPYEITPNFCFRNGEINCDIFSNT